MQQVTKFQTNDGSLFDDISSAQKYIETSFYDQYICKQVEIVAYRVKIMDFILKNKDAIKEMLDDLEFELDDFDLY